MENGDIMSMLTILLFGIVVLTTHFLEGITGFGCTVLALPFAVILVGIKTAVPVLTILAWILALYIIVIDFKSILWREYLRILAFVAVGLPIGIFLYSYLPEFILKKFLGIFMILVSLRGLYISYNKKPARKLNNPVLNFVLFLGGIIHGAFSTGGPFVVIYATQAIKNKNNFRATLCTLWVTLNTIIITKNIYKGVFTTEVTNLLLLSLPFLISGMVLGNWAHHHIPDKGFTKVVYMVLLFSGFFMFL